MKLIDRVTGWVTWRLGRSDTWMKRTAEEEGERLIGHTHFLIFSSLESGLRDESGKPVLFCAVGKPVLCISGTSYLLSIILPPCFPASSSTLSSMSPNTLSLMIRGRKGVEGRTVHYSE